MHHSRALTLAALTLGVAAGSSLGRSPVAAVTNDPVPHVFVAGEVASAVQVNENFDALVQRVDIDGDNIVVGSIVRELLADNAVDGDVLAAGAVGSEHLAPGSVGTNQLAAGAVGALQLQVAAVGTAHLQPDVIGGDQLQDAAVGVEHLQQQVVGSEQLQDLAVASAHLQLGSVDSDQLADGAVSGEQLQADAVTALHVVDGSLTGADVSTSSGDVSHMNAALGIGVADPFEALDIVASQTGVIDAESDSSVANLIQLDRTVAIDGAADMISLDVPQGTGPEVAFLECSDDVGNVFQVQVSGDVLADGAFTGPADFAEMIEVSTGAVTVEAGDVLVIDPRDHRKVTAASTPRSTLVAGVYSTRPGFVGSHRDWDKPGEGERASYSRADFADLYDEVPMAVVGIVPCKVSAENGAIRPGDLLVTSNVAGHAMRDESPATGTVVGKALQAHDEGLGVIDILVTLH